MSMPFTAKAGERSGRQGAESLNDDLTNAHSLNNHGLESGAGVSESMQIV